MNSLNSDNDSHRVSLESLKRYAPVYQDALKAKEILDEKYSHKNADEYIFTDSENISAEKNNVDVDDMDTIIEVSSLEAQYYRGMFALEKLIEQATPLLHSEVSKIASKAAFYDAEEIRPILFYEAITGLKKGLAKYSPERNMKSVTNYLFQWATTYAKRELNKLEAPFGVPPSRYEKYKKVSAVRNKITEQLGRYATNEEVLEYFHSGSADLKTFNGPVALKDSGSRANREIDMKLVKDQEYFEKNLAYTKYLNDDNGEFYPDNVLSVNSEFIQGERSIFKDFLEEQDFSDTVKSVILNETQSNVSDSIIQDLGCLSEEKYKQIVKDFRALAREKNGKFHKFIEKKISSDDISGYDADIRRIKKDLDASSEPKTKRKYKSLYEEDQEAIEDGNSS